jgi:hypothetical protein
LKRLEAHNGCSRISIIYGSFAFRAAATGEFFLQIAWLWAAAGQLHTFASLLGAGIAEANP